jgi:hypothetical protein
MLSHARGGRVIIMQIAPTEGTRISRPCWMEVFIRMLTQGFVDVAVEAHPRRDKSVLQSMNQHDAIIELDLQLFIARESFGHSGETIPIPGIHICRRGQQHKCSA